MPRLWPEFAVESVVETPLTTVSDEILETTIERVLKEQKIMNLHLSVMSDNQFTKEDVE